MSFKEFSLINNRGETLYGNSWLVDKNAKGNVVISHGMCEHTMRYEPLAKKLNEAGYNVYGLDHIGHKLNCSEGYLVWPIDGFERCVDNLYCLLDSLKGEPLYLISHSMGSFIAQALIERKDTSILSGVILIGTNGPTPLYKFGKVITRTHALFVDGKKPSKFLNSIVFSGYNKRFKDGNTKLEWLSASKTNIENYQNDEYCGGIPSTNFFRSFLNNLAKIHRKKELLKIDKNIKLLILGGEDDPVGNYGKGIFKLQTIYAKYGISSIAKVFPKMRHEILNEEDNENVYTIILDFIADKI